MKYIGNICAGCGEGFTQTDDVVVCPECGTPQHRHCYEKENRCVCEEKHGENYVWEGITPVTFSEPKEKTEYFPCPNCSYENPKGTEQCKNCGMKFTVFGMNIVDSLHQDEITKQKSAGIPDYPAPFTLGDGDGFDNITEEPAAAEKEETENIPSDSEKKTADERIILAGPFPLTDEIEGVKTNTVGNFIGANGMSYIAKFKKLAEGKKISFNFAAFFFTPYWFFYRKLYKAGIAFMTVLLALAVVFAPAMASFLELYETLPADMAAMYEYMAALGEAELAALYGKMMPAMIYLGISLLIKLICGFTANPLYKNYVITNGKKIERAENKTSAIMLLRRVGGISFIATIIAFMAEEGISLLATFLMNN